MRNVNIEIYETIAHFVKIMCPRKHILDVRNIDDKNWSVKFTSLLKFKKWYQEVPENNRFYVIIQNNKSLSLNFNL